MRRWILCCLLMGTMLPVIAQKAADKNLARVKKVNGVEAYILCEPVRPYEVVVDAGTGFKAESLLTGGIINKSISGRVEQFVRNIMKQNAKIDAVIYSAGKRIVGIVFTDEGNKTDEGMARVSRIMGYHVFVMNEPVIDYSVLNNRGGGIKWKSLVTAGVMNNSIEEDVQEMVKKLQNRAADAMLFEGGKEGMTIMFKN
ncbi:MAG: hypothetical protein ACXWV5_04375 [Flavitalea sp.]